MPKKKVVPQEEPEQAVEPLEQTGTEFPVPPEEPPLDENVPDGSPPPEMSGLDEPTPLPVDDPGVPVESEVDTPEVMAVGASDSPTLLEDGPFAEPPVEVPEAPPIVDISPLADEPTPTQRKSAPSGEAPPVPPRTDRQDFFAMDFREVDRDLTAEERQAWSSIYASFRGRSALSGTVIGADPHSMNVRNRETGKVERRSMYCVVVLLYRVPVYIPASEMWIDEAPPDYVLQNMMGATIDFIITKVDREGGYAIASRRQASRAQR